jgi:protein tyrosine phosphatase
MRTPVLVHCSAGIGRTGSFIAIYLIIESIIALRALKKKNDIASEETKNNGEDIETP